ncbi:hypothetical protein P8452_03467 [Trifolium repens]|nr:hypothetical protein P8452_03467 [Trifolium repens]
MLAHTKELVAKTKAASVSNFAAIVDVVVLPFPPPVNDEDTRRVEMLAKDGFPSPSRREKRSMRNGDSRAWWGGG